MRQTALKSDIEELRQELNKAIDRAASISFCDGYVLGLSRKLDKLIVQFMENKNDSNKPSEEDLYAQLI